MITRTAVVTHAANLGPRTSTVSGWVVVLLLGTGLLLDKPVAFVLLGTNDGRRATVTFRAAPSATRKRVRLSSYSDSNSPRCGTDRLRGVG
ncbi:hypothetical protein MPRS_31300 [Mycobacterium paraseoulense]|nr:hypothetical protein MPRS_31300 [Mycobacterium paraseoulense]